MREEKKYIYIYIYMNCGERKREGQQKEKEKTRWFYLSLYGVVWYTQLKSLFYDLNLKSADSTKKKKMNKIDSQILHVSQFHGHVCQFHLKTRENEGEVSILNNIGFIQNKNIEKSNHIGNTKIYVVRLKAYIHRWRSRESFHYENKEITKITPKHSHKAQTPNIPKELSLSLSKNRPRE